MSDPARTHRPIVLRIASAALLPLPVGALALLACATSAAQVVFDDVTDGSGLEYTGESYGAAWGDMNGDGYPDVTVTHHRNPSGLYVNRGNDTFIDRAAEIDAWQATPRSDVHGATWADFNNDGRLDLFVTAGSKNYSQFLVNNGTTLVDRIHDYDFDSQNWGGRFPFWFDYDSDGLLDLGVVVQGGKVHLHQQTGGEFVKQNFASGHQCANGDFSLLSDVTMDGRVDWVCVNTGALPERIYDLSAGMPFADSTSLSTKVSNIADVAIADFDGDLLMDLFALRGKVRLNGAALTAPRKIEAHMSTIGAQAAGFTFKSSGDVTLELHWSGQKAGRVFIGANGLHPPAAESGEPIRVVLSASDPGTHGLMTYSAGTDNGIYIGYDPATQVWKFVNSAGGSRAASSTYSFMSSSAAVSNLGVFGVPNAHRPVRPALLKYAGTQYTNQVKGTGLDRSELCVSVAAADFDNDMDMDLYYVCRDAVLNIANKLYLNDGTGRFAPASAPFGAEGPVGAGVGLGETVAVSDYDVDGFVDLFVTNGLGLFPEEPYGHGGPDRLYRNRGNTNRWIELDLNGLASNRDGIGAIVTVTAGGKAQRREQTGGYHRWAQHDARLHFGLGTYSTANISILWPSGEQDTFTKVAANRLYEATEGGAELRTVTPGAAPPPDCLKTSGTPQYDKNTDRAVFLWRTSCTSKQWNVLVTGGAGPTLRFSGQAASTAAITNVTRVLLEQWDTLELSGDGKLLDFGLASAAAGKDGFEFDVDPAAENCFGLGSSVEKVYVGAAGTAVTTPFDLRTLAPCGP